MKKASFCSVFLIALVVLLYWAIEPNKVSNGSYMAKTDNIQNSPEATYEQEKTDGKDGKKYAVSRVVDPVSEAIVQKNSGKPISGNDSDTPLGQQFEQLLELDQSLDNSNEKFKTLIAEYDQDIGNTELEQQLSSTLLNDSEYRVAILKKFKVERELATSK